MSTDPKAASTNINGSQDTNSNQNFNSTSDPNQQQQKPNIRHIPIYVEGRADPIVNKNNDISSSPKTKGINAPTVGPSRSAPRSLFDRVKNFPVRTDGMEPMQIPVKHERQYGGGVSQVDNSKPNPQSQPQSERTIPVQHEYNMSQNRSGMQPDLFQQQQKQYQQQQQQKYQQFQQQHQQQQPQQRQYQQQQGNPQQSQQSQQFPHQQSQQFQQQQPQPSFEQKKSGTLPTEDNSPIAKIQKIQEEVLKLMTKVDEYQGSTRKDRDYLYLDEMLTQNLLKLDNINADGNENIKQARKEAINCINKCISVLEAKAEAFEANNTSSSDNATQQNQLNSDNKSENDQNRSPVGSQGSSLHSQTQ